MKVLFAAAEVAPFAKVGGLADVAGALPRALAALGHDVRIVMPHYAPIDEAQFDLRPVLGAFTVPAPDGPEPAALRETELGGVPVYLVENERYLGRERVYGYPDDLDRFIFFCRAVLEAVRRLGWRPDVVHVNDWHTAPIAAWLGTTLRRDPFFGPLASVLTIHNLAFQGWFDESFRQRWNVVPPEVVARPVDGVDLHNALALGIAYADAVNTVSETYAREILTPEYGERLDPLLRSRRDRLFGIVNGIDYEFFNPATDPFIARNYDVDHLDDKVEDKRALQREASLREDPSLPLVGVVGRLTDQKGFDLVAAALPPLLDEVPFQFVLLGTGEPRYHELIGQMVARHPDSAEAWFKFDAALAQRIYAGADIFLMPSRFEPCGLGQLISLRYGTVPVVRRTGGLADTVQDFDPQTGQGTGFVFEEYTPSALRTALLRALEAFRDRPVWRALQQRGMRQDVSWGASALKYEELYRFAVGVRTNAR